MRWIRTGSLLACYLLLSGIAQFDGALPGTLIQALKIGAGGQITNLDIQCNQGVGQCNNSGTVTRVARTDTYGAWIFDNTSGLWRQLVTSTFPDNLFGDAAGPNGCCGVYEIRIAPSNTQIFYMYLNGYLYKTTNQGTTWTRTAFSRVPANPNTGTKFEGPFLAIDPANANVVYVGTPLSGIFYTTNGGTSWTAISTGTIAAGTTASGGLLSSTQAGGNLIAFDTGSSGCTRPVGDLSQCIYICSYGTGCYRTTNAGTTWWKIEATGMPTTFIHIFCDQNGTLWVTDNANFGLANNLHAYASGAWRAITDGTNYNKRNVSIAVNPNTSGSGLEIVAGNDGGGFNFSTDNGLTWTTYVYPPVRAASDVPWLANTNENYMTNGNQVFDPSGSNLVYMAEGIGVWHTTPTRSTIRWTSQNAGLEQLVAHWIVSPPGGTVLTAEGDRSSFQVTSPTQVYPTHHSIDDNRATGIIAGYSVDWCSSTPATVVLLAQGLNKVDYSGISTSGGGYNSWTKFTSLGTPPANSASIYQGGAIACGTPSKIVWEEANNGGLYYTANGGASWSASSTGLSQNDTGWFGPNYLNRENVIADRVNTGMFYAYNSGRYAPGVYKSIDGGATFTLTAVTGHFDVGDTVSAQMRSVPGNGGNFYYTSGYNTGTNFRFYECSDNGTVRCSAVPSVTNVWSFGLGKAKPGGVGYPTIFIYGKVSGVMGLWRSDDHHKTWVKLSGQFVNNSMDQVVVVEGDNNAYGTVYIGFNGSGFAYGTLH
jgi:photosystem II stability/assembly factor-like uncharacterized protein